MIAYTDSLEGVTPEHLVGFFEGWPCPPCPERHLAILQGSAHVVLAIEPEPFRVVGFITSISDGISSAYIPHLEVLTEHRGAGIGSELVRLMLEKLQHLYMVDLMCDEDVQPFYEKVGMRPYQGMIYRNYRRQSCQA